MSIGLEYKINGSTTENDYISHSHLGANAYPYSPSSQDATLFWDKKVSLFSTKNVKWDTWFRTEENTARDIHLTGGDGCQESSVEF